MNDRTAADDRGQPAPVPELLAIGARLPEGRLKREWATIAAMVQGYCRGHHATSGSFCSECHILLQYATLRLERCRFGAGKPTCANCPVHCYERQRRDQVKVVMRYAGPRMLWQHPFLSLRHWLDGFRRVELSAPKKQGVLV